MLVQFKDAIVTIVIYFFGFFIAFWVAGLSPYQPHGVYWFMVAAGVVVAYVLVVWLLQLAWARWRFGQKGPP
jgi:hypothetical protein